MKDKQATHRFEYFRDEVRFESCSPQRLLSLLAICRLDFEFTFQEAQGLFRDVHSTEDEKQERENQQRSNRVMWDEL